MKSRVRVERGESGRRYAVSREYAVPPERAWTVLAETAHWPTWGPTVSAVRPADATVKEGLTGEAQVLGGPWVPFEVTAVEGDADGDVRRWTWSVARIPATGHRVERVHRDAGGDGCRVVFEVPLLAGGYVPVCQRALAALATEFEE
ncbi:SRPBCC family protein [Halorubellus litoreus]|uniref:SRPBCC family protein n=1 Tax=Halorubellus litoreus TaxID=755308 RepID=A0ABD5VF07_9EURY